MTPDAPGAATAPAPAAPPARPLPPIESLGLPAPGAAKPGAEPDRGTTQTGATPHNDSEALEARANLAAGLYDGGRSAEAERAYREILERHPGHVASLVGLAQILIDRDDLDGAGAANARARKENPRSIPALRQESALLLARDKTAEAVRVAESAVQIDPNSPASHAALGDAQRNFGDLPKAIESYRKAVGLNPGWAPGWARLGEALSENGDAAPAQAALTRALEINPSSYPAWRALARLYFDNGQPDQAAEAWGRALRLQPDRGEAHEEMAMALLAAGRPAEARPHALEAQRRGRDVRALLERIAGPGAP